MDWKSN